MSLSTTSAMTLAKAITIAADVEKAVRLWGKNAKQVYRPEDVQAALAKLYQERQNVADAAVPKELLTKANRQLAACKAQKARLVKKYGIAEVEVEGLHPNQNSEGRFVDDEDNSIT